MVVKIWGFIKADYIEIVHKIICRRIIGVKTATNSLYLYSRVGKIPTLYPALHKNYQILV